MLLMNMSLELAHKLYREVKSPIYGFAFSKHFWERYVERFKTDLSPLEGLMQRIDKDLCLLIFEAAKKEHHPQVIIFHSGAKIPLTLIMGDSPKLLASTIYC